MVKSTQQLSENNDRVFLLITSQSKQSRKSINWSLMESQYFQDFLPLSSPNVWMTGGKCHATLQREPWFLLLRPGADWLQVTRQTHRSSSQPHSCQTPSGAWRVRTADWLPDASFWHKRNVFVLNRLFPKQTDTGPVMLWSVCSRAEQRICTLGHDTWPYPLLFLVS